MKQIIKLTVFALFFSILIVGCNTNKKEENLQNDKKNRIENKNSWSEEQIAAFKNNSNLFLKAHHVENPEKYTDCLLKTVMKEYPEAEKALYSNQEDMIALFEKSDCIDDLILVKIESKWNKETETIFLNKCIAAARKNSMSEKDAKEYCNCALTKVKKIIPNPQYVITLTEEEYNSVLKECKK